MRKAPLKPEEVKLLEDAQLQAANLTDYAQWRTWMRHTHSYALAVRMAVFVGCKMPGKDFYNTMLKHGQRLKESKAA